jgi:hypothetical protein
MDSASICEKIPVVDREWSGVTFTLVDDGPPCPRWGLPIYVDRPGAIAGGVGPTQKEIWNVTRVLMCAYLPSLRQCVQCGSGVSTSLPER